MNAQTHRFYISRILQIFSTILLGFLTAPALSAMNDTSASRNKVADFDGDGKSDISVWRSSEGYWHIMKSSGGFSSVQWGQAGDALVPGDYDGDGKTDTAVYRKGDFQDSGEINLLYVLRSSDNAFFARKWGTSPGGFTRDRAFPADYDGDGKTDLAIVAYGDVISPGNVPSVLRILQSATDTGINRVWGFTSDRLVPADYDGDGKADLAVVRFNYSFGSKEAGVWYILQSSNGAMRTMAFGLSTDRLLPADYDGDGKADIAVWRPENGFWYIQGSKDGFRAEHFGAATDRLVPADYDGDGKTDIAVFRPSNSTWYLQQSREGFAAHVFGFPDDIPIPFVYLR